MLISFCRALWLLEKSGEPEVALIGRSRGAESLGEPRESWPGSRRAAPSKPSLLGQVNSAHYWANSVITCKVNEPNFKYSG